MLLRGEQPAVSATARPHGKPTKCSSTTLTHRNPRKRHTIQNNVFGPSSASRSQNLSAQRTTINAAFGSTFTSSTSRKPRHSTLRPTLSTIITLGLLFTLSSGISFTSPFSTKTLRGSSFRASATTGSVSAPDVSIAIVAPFDKDSPLGPKWSSVLPHMADRLRWNDPGLSLRYLDSKEILKQSDTGTALSLFDGDDMVIALGVEDLPAVDAVLAATKGLSTFAALGSAEKLQAAARIAGNSVSLTDPTTETGLSGLLGTIQAALFPSVRLARHQAHALATMRELYSRHTSDDLLFSFLVLVNEAVRPVAAVSNSTKRADAGLDAVQCMIGNCGGEMFRCFTDATCRTALDCMNACAFNDQEPNPPPMASFQGLPLTHELAEGLFVGWLDGAASQVQHRPSTLDPFSWRVFAGKNPAYDFFPCQFQLFYPGKAKGSFWYQPVFKVLTLDSSTTWRQRLYRVRRDKTPGAFFLSVLDNGVTSSERWTILDCDEGLDWCVFYYRGAAAAAGMSYTGAVLGSRDGGWPTAPEALDRIEKALDKAGIKMWELSTVNNDECDGPPLNLIGPTA